MGKSYEKLKLLEDIAFKYFFGQEIMKNNTEYLVNTILEFNDMNLNGSMNIAENKAITLPIYDGKTLKFDVVGFNDYEVIDIEVENRKKGNYLWRIEAYASALHLENFKRGEEYEDFKTTITINILDYNLVKDGKFFEYQTTTFGDKNKSNGKINHYLIQLPKFRKHIKKLIKKQGLKHFINYLYDKKLYRLLLFLDNKTNDNILKEVLKMDAVLSDINNQKTYVEENKEGSKNMKEFLIEYKKHNQETINWNEVRADGKKEGKIEGKIEGLKEGKIEGLKEGEIKGLKKGKIEGLKEGEIKKEKIIIENMKKYGLSDEEINKIISIK
ncbi:MAG: PD-(D/E)XK nuclease family transposase [Methanobrevibacter sp.]|jgi:predicted transposase/invertase (TIGR01784 family)|nr:PD-(D/E)XK nuclease family transposase [Methanobrevibacter sp.]